MRDGWEREDLRREALAGLVRECLLAGHLIDRSGMPQVLSRYGREAMRDVAIEEWRAASPVYTRRMQALLGFGRGDVETIFKGMQLDIGAPPQFMDFRYAVEGKGAGEFWLDSCGALMDVEPLGDQFVETMCHHIEDPTFDATAAATDPRARMRPVHRPPRMPADRHPHCHWTVTIDPDAEPLPEPAEADRLASTRAARLPLPVIDEDDGGRADYAGPLEDDLRLEAFSRSALLAVLDEVCLQGQLLALSFSAAVGRRYGADVAVELSTAQFTGVAGLVAGRLRRALDPEPGPEAVAAVLRAHPAFSPRAYVDLRVDVGGDGVDVVLADCEALAEELSPSWPALLAGGAVRPLEAIVQAVEPRARCAAVGHRRWHIDVDPAAAPVGEPDEVTLAKFSTGADFEFASR